MFEEKSVVFFQVPAGAMEESSGEDDDSNVQDKKLKIDITNKNVHDFFGVKFSVHLPTELKAYASAIPVFDVSVHLSINVHPLRPSKKFSLIVINSWKYCIYINYCLQI